MTIAAPEIRTDYLPTTRIAPKDWEAALHRLADQIVLWSEQEEGWTVLRTDIGHVDSHPDRRYLDESERIFTYTAPHLTIDTPDGQLQFEAKYSSFLVGRGRIDLYSQESLNRVRLFPIDTAADDWEIYTDSGVRLPMYWSRSAFLYVARELLSAYDRLEL